MSTILCKSNAILQSESEVGDAMLLKMIASESSQGQMKAAQLENKLGQKQQTTTKNEQKTNKNKKNT